MKGCFVRTLLRKKGHATHLPVLSNATAKLGWESTILTPPFQQLSIKTQIKRLKTLVSNQAGFGLVIVVVVAN
jgi:hypothetical protein